MSQTGIALSQPGRNYNMMVHKIAGDGNCLFQAVIHQLKQLYPHRPLCTVSQLRATVVSYIRNSFNLETFIPTLLDSCLQAYGPDICSALSEAQLVTKYLNDLQQDGFWGGAECLSVISILERIKITVHIAGTQGQTSFTPHTGIYHQELNLLYNGSHYDSVLLQPVPPSSSESTPDSSSSLRVQEPRTIRSTNNPFVLVEDREAIHVTPPPATSASFCIGTWNVRGVNKPYKRDLIDKVLDRNKIAICGIQETNMRTGTCTTENYM